MPPTAPVPPPVADSALHRAMSIVRRTLWMVAFFSFFINLLALTGSLYMLQVYDRVLASRSLSTLLYLTLFAGGCLLALVALEVVRSRLLVRMGVRFDAALSGLAFNRTLQGAQSGQMLRDLDQVRIFFSGATMLSLLDAPWIPVYVGLVYLLHPWLGHVALAGGVVLLLLALWNERATRGPLAEAGREAAQGVRFAELSARNAEVVRAMGMLPALSRVWRKHQQMGLGLQGLASDKAATVAAVAKAMRMFLQVAILGVGAWLVILEQTTAGVMIAASIIMGRGLAPIESAIGSWRQLLASREAYARMARDIGQVADQAPAMPLPRPRGRLVFDAVSGGPPDARRATVQGVSFALEPGTCLGVTGPSGAGKSSLLRLALGVWRPLAGTVTLDDANIADWRREDVGPAIGYLPQDIELFPGTVAENIARFGEPNPEQVVAAAQLAGAHAMVLSLPAGYDTPIGPQGANLSGGQRQRIGLARAFYGEPTLVVLDEPTSNLDAEGETAVRQAMDELKRLGRTLLVVAHRPAVLGGTDRLAVVVDGKLAACGPTHEVMPSITRRVNAPAGPSAPNAPLAPTAPAAAPAAVAPAAVPGNWLVSQLPGKSRRPPGGPGGAHG